MGRRIGFALLASAALSLMSCPNPLMNKVIAVVAQKDMLPKINLKSPTGSITTGGSFSFGTISINTSKDVTFTIENLGSAALFLTDTPKVSISGTDAALFTVVSDPTNSIPAGQSSSFVVRFLPTTNGAKSATLTIPNSDATNSNYSVSLSGSGSIQAAMRVLQGITDIPPGTGFYSYPQTGLTFTTADIIFTIKNVGTATLNLTGTPKVQVPGSDFVVTQPISASIPASSGTTTFTMHFSPTTEGILTATITIPNDDPDRSPFTFTARGIASTVMLPKTGQTTPYPTAGNKDDGDLQIGVTWPSTRFTSGASTIIDNLTGLEWSKAGNLLSTNFPGLGLDPDAPVDDGKVTWQHALDFVAYLNTNSFASHSDWRLPNRAELRSLLNTEQSDSSTWLVSQGFSNVQADFYWSSTNDHLTSTSAWYVDMSIGQSSYSAKTTTYYVWPVRGGSGGTVRLARTGQTTSISANDDGNLKKGAVWPATRFVADTSSTVMDLLTGLIWEKSPSTTGVSWTAALAAAQASSTGGYTDWRLPNIIELSSLLDAEQGSTAGSLNALGFTNVTATAYWSSSTCKAVTSQAWTVNFGEGQILYSALKSGSRYVFLVRSAP